MLLAWPFTPFLSFGVVVDVVALPLSCLLFWLYFILLSIPRSILTATADKASLTGAFDV
ncbi:hypothetical protein GALMADRAFT_1302116 [Galerina marginata CBS 339.88]|uniref:Uncharacterized protein n=1 Tax=Galerina marginata (strain CBS 339.88) TaxID=685588 RepID=A0A067TGK5_GALM3|nr:hypothetical protein GALMADRAFT_1302116 [Galerina marginata CBS 339.88]